MPKKTRKEKALADKRRSQISQTGTFSFTATKHINAPVATASTQAYIRSDIQRTVIVGTLFIGIECILYIVFKRFGW
jgi:hypothetical protein